MARCPVCSHITLVPSTSDVGQSAARSAEPLPSVAPASWYMRTPEGQEFGPATRADLDRWLSEGRIAADCFLRDGEFGQWQSADQIFFELTPAPIVPTPAMAPVNTWIPPAPLPGQSQLPATPYNPSAANYASAPNYGPRTTTYQTPHRGALILVLGLLGLFLQPCPGPIFSFIAWAMGSNDLREMDAGRMDRSGADLTRTGMILGMVISVLWIIGFLIVGGIFFLASLAG